MSTTNPPPALQSQVVPAVATAYASEPVIATTVSESQYSSEQSKVNITQPAKPTPSCASDSEDEGSGKFSVDEDANLTLSRTRTNENIAETVEVFAKDGGSDVGNKVVGEITSPAIIGETTAVVPPVAPVTDHKVQSAAAKASNSQPQIQIKSSDFLFGSTLGEGSFARVVHCRLKSMQKDYAMKILEKMHIKKQKKVSTVLMEKDILIRFSHPMIIKLYYCFTDPNYIYMCMDLAPGGELGKVIDTSKRLKQSQGIKGQACDMRTTQFYIAELVEALEYLHANRIVHRDLKPENVLLTAEGHIKIADFGTALLGEDDENSFDGTALYVSPEVLNSAPATKSCDLWALGCIMFQMLTGNTPFSGETEYLIFENIQNYVQGTFILSYADHMSADAKALIMKLLHPEADQRIGGGVDDPDNEGNSNGYGTLKGHPFFDGVEWGRLLQTTPPYTPNPAEFPNPEELTDGACDEWMLGGEATIINPQLHKVSIDSKCDNASIGGVDAHMKSTSENVAARDEVWRSFLLKGEQQLFTGLTVKRKGLFSKQRRLVLTDLPRLFYVDPDSKELKGEIPWDAENPVQCTIVDNWKFDVLATKTNRVYHLLDKEVGSTVWVDLINAMLEKQAIEYKARER